MANQDAAGFDWKKLLIKLGPVIGLVFVWLLFWSQLGGRFANVPAQTEVLRQSAVIGIAALAVPMVAILGAHISGRGFATGFNPRHFGPLVYITALGFGFIHITNFDASSFDYTYWFVIPMLVVPQCMAGIVYMYVRRRLGFWAAVRIHGLENLVLTLLAVSE